MEPNKQVQLMEQIIEENNLTGQEVLQLFLSWEGSSILTGSFFEHIKEEGYYIPNQQPFFKATAYLGLSNTHGMEIMLLDNDTDGLYYRFVTDDTLSEEVYAHIKYAEDGLGFVVPTIEVHGAIYSLEEFMKA